MSGNRMVKYFYKVYCEIYIYIGAASYLGNRRFKYFHKCIVEYTDIVGASCLGIEGLNISINVL
jgi:hypothetical protein